MTCMPMVEPARTESSKLPKGRIRAVADALSVYVLRLWLPNMPDVSHIVPRRWGRPFQNAQSIRRCWFDSSATSSRADIAACELKPLISSSASDPASLELQTLTRMSSLADWSWILMITMQSLVKREGGVAET